MSIFYYILNLYSRDYVYCSPLLHLPPALHIEIKETKEKRQNRKEKNKRGDTLKTEKKKRRKKTDEA